MLHDKINSLKNKLDAATGNAAPTTTKTYTSLCPGTGNPQKGV